MDGPTDRDVSRSLRQNESKRWRGLMFSIHLPHRHSHFPCSQHGCTSHFKDHQQKRELLFKQLHIIIPTLKLSENHLLFVFRKVVRNGDCIVNIRGGPKVAIFFTLLERKQNKSGNLARNLQPVAVLLTAPT